MEAQKKSDNNGENVLQLEITDVTLVYYCDLVNSNYQHESRVLYAFVPNKPFAHSEISPWKFIFSMTFES